MKSLILVLLSATLLCQVAKGQSIPVELISDGNYIWYQHSVTRKFSGETRFGFSHVSSLYAYSTSARSTELMSQSYISFELTPGIRIATGSFYASAPGFSASFAVQFFRQHKDLLLLIIPRADIKRKGSFDVMAMLQYRPAITNKVKFYSRLQLMSNYSTAQHNRSYQYVRAGVDMKNIQFGLGLNLDHYGKNYTNYLNSGLFLRTEF